MATQAEVNKLRKEQREALAKQPVHLSIGAGKLACGASIVGGTGVGVSDGTRITELVGEITCPKCKPRS